MRLINFVGLFFLLFSFVVEGRNLPVRQLGKELRQHPRLLFSKQEEQRVRDLFGTEPLLDSLRASLMREAERLLSVPPQEDPRRKIKNTKDILPVSREQVYRMVNLTLAYRLSGEGGERVDSCLQFLGLGPCSLLGCGGNDDGCSHWLRLAVRCIGPFDQTAGCSFD